MTGKRGNFTYASNNGSSQPPPFLRLAEPLIKIHRWLGFFPANQATFHWSNTWHFIVIAVLIVMNVYFATYKVLMALKEMLTTSITASASVQLSLYIYLCFGLSCVIFLFNTGRRRKLEAFSELLFQATKQKAIEKKYSILRRNLIAFTLSMSSIVSPIVAFLPMVLFSNLLHNWPAVDTFRNLLFYDVWYINLFLSIFIAYIVIANISWIVIYVAVCECLIAEFNQINQALREMNIRETLPFRERALEHSRLLKCLHFLQEYCAASMFICFSIITVMSIIFAYILFLDVDIGLRCLVGFWLLGNAGITFTFCKYAETLAITARDAKEIVCAKMAEEHCKSELDDVTFKTGCIITQQASSDVEISAYGFFPVSKDSLLALTSFVATYVVILLQTPSAMEGMKKNANFNSQNDSLV